MYILNFIKEANIWRKVRAIAKENEAEFNQQGFRVDWIGRIYTVINLPEEVINQPISREGYVLMKLREYDMLFLNMGIADVISPELIELSDTDSYLLILSPDRDFIKIGPFLWWATKMVGLLILLRILYNVVARYGSDILNFLSKVYHFIF